MFANTIFVQQPGRHYCTVCILVPMQYVAATLYSVNDRSLPLTALDPNYNYTFYPTAFVDTFATLKCSPWLALWDNVILYITVHTHIHIHCPKVFPAVLLAPKQVCVCLSLSRLRTHICTYTAIVSINPCCTSILYTEFQSFKWVMPRNINTLYMAANSLFYMTHHGPHL